MVSLILNNFVSIISWTCYKGLGIKCRCRFGGWQNSAVFWTVIALLRFRKFLPKQYLKSILMHEKTLAQRMISFSTLQIWVLTFAFPTRYTLLISLLQLGTRSLFRFFIAAAFYYWILMPSRSADAITSQTAFTFCSRLGPAGAPSSLQLLSEERDVATERTPTPERDRRSHPRGHRDGDVVGAARGAQAGPAQLLRLHPAVWLQRPEETGGTWGSSCGPTNHTTTVRAHREHVLRRRTRGNTIVTAWGRERRPLYFPPPPPPPSPRVRRPGRCAQGSPH